MAGTVFHKMQIMKNSTFLMLVAFMALLGTSLTTTTHAQNQTLEVIGAGGGKFSTSKYSMDWTLGETAISSWASTDKIVTVGFQQPRLEVILEKPRTTAPNVSIAPNPVQSTLNIQLAFESKTQLSAQLLDVQGKILAKRIPLNQPNTELNMENLPSGMYFLHIYTTKGEPLEVFKVIKNN
jgi:hypothetical protein